MNSTLCARVAGKRAYRGIIGRRKNRNHTIIDCVAHIVLARTRIMGNLYERAGYTARFTSGGIDSTGIDNIAYDASVGST